MALALLVLAFWWFGGGDTPTAPPEPVAAAPRPGARPLGVGVVGEEPEVAPSTEEAVVDAMGALAKADGRGFVRCAIGEVVSGPVHASGLVHPRVSGGVLVAEVDEPEGNTVLYADVSAGELEIRVATLGEDGRLVVEPPSPASAAREDDASMPRARLAWTDATPGHQGTCRVDPAVPVELAVRSGDGQATSGLSATGCAVLSSRSSDADGRYVVRATSGMPCELVLTRLERGEDGEATLSEASGRVDDPKDGDAITLGGWVVLESEDDPDKVDDEPDEEDAWERALATEGLAPEARAVLESWQEEEFQGADELGRQWMQLGELLKGEGQP